MFIIVFKHEQIDNKFKIIKIINFFFFFFSDKKLPKAC